MPRHAFALVGVCALTFFVGLDRPALTDSDEAFYAESAREMIERGDWLTPYYNGEPRFDKPVLYYWLVAASYAAAGSSPGAARFPAALAGVGLVLVTFFCARRWYDEPTAFLAGLIAATSAGIVAMARQALPDLPLAFFMTLSTWAALVALLDDPGRQPDPGERRRWLLLAGLAAGGAFLVKGPVGPALTAVVVLPLLAIEWRRSGGVMLRATAADLALASAVFLLVALPWYVAMAAEHGAGYLERFFVAENLERFATGPLQRAAARLVLPAHRGWRTASLDTVHDPLGAGGAPRLARPSARCMRLAACDLGNCAAGVLYAVGREAAQVHPCLC